MHKGIVLVVIEAFHTPIVAVVITRVYEFVKIHRTASLKRVFLFFVFFFYLNKPKKTIQCGNPKYIRV